MGFKKDSYNLQKSERELREAEENGETCAPQSMVGVERWERVERTYTQGKRQYAAQHAVQSK
jgi:hypothetical protein